MSPGSTWNRRRAPGQYAQHAEASPRPWCREAQEAVTSAPSGTGITSSRANSIDLTLQVPPRQRTHSQTEPAQSPSTVIVNSDLRRESRLRARSLSTWNADPSRHPGQASAAHGGPHAGPCRAAATRPMAPRDGAPSARAPHEVGSRSTWNAKSRWMPARPHAMTAMGVAHRNPSLPQVNQAPPLSSRRRRSPLPHPGVRDEHGCLHRPGALTTWRCHQGPADEAPMPACNAAPCAPPTGFTQPGLGPACNAAPGRRHQARPQRPREAAPHDVSPQPHRARRITSWSLPSLRRAQSTRSARNAGPSGNSSDFVGHSPPLASGAAPGADSAPFSDTTAPPLASGAALGADSAPSSDTTVPPLASGAALGADSSDFAGPSLRVASDAAPRAGFSDLAGSTSRALERHGTAR